MAESDATMPPSPPPPPQSSRLPLKRTVALLIAAVAIVVLVATALLWNARPQLSEEQVRSVVYSTIQREAPASILITGWLEVTAVTRVENTRTLLPGIMNLDLGTTSATVRVPGRVSYGFDVRQLRPEMIRVMGDTLIEVDVPAPTIYSVEPNLSQMEVETRRGWARISQSTLEEVRERAIVLVQGTLARQGNQHLSSSTQPHINTASALHSMLVPVLVAAGIENPKIRFRIGESVVVEPGARYREP